MTETVHTTVLVEGASDAAAVQSLARRLGRDLDGDGVSVVSLGGITNLRSVATRLHGDGGRIAGLYDAPEEHVVRRALVASGLTRAAEGDLESYGFFCCSRDLEDELLRAAGLATAERVIEKAGEARSLGRLAQMPAQKGWSREQVLRRFLTSQSGRKERYAGLLIEAIPAGSEPAPLVRLLAHVR